MATLKWDHFTLPTWKNVAASVESVVAEVEAEVKKVEAEIVAKIEPAVVAPVVTPAK